MLKEISDLTQTSDDLTRHWYSDGETDLYVWYNGKDQIIEFQLSYGKENKEKVFSWSNKSGIKSYIVDDGYKGPLDIKSSPILSSESLTNIEQVREIFRRTGQGLEQDLYEFILAKIAVAD